MDQSIEAAPMAYAIVICFASCIDSSVSVSPRWNRTLTFLKSSRAEHQQEVSSVSGDVILSSRGDATSICPITGQPSLAPISVTRIAIGAILRWTFPLRGAIRAYPVPLK